MPFLFLKELNVLTLTELARHLRVKPSWIYDKTKKGGDIPVKRVGKYLRFSLPEVEEWLARKYGNGNRDNE